MSKKIIYKKVFMMFKKSLVIFSILLLFINFNSKAAMLSKQECADRIERFKKSEKTLRLYLKDLQDDFNNFTYEVQNIVNHAKRTAEKMGGNAQRQYYKEFSTLKNNLYDKIRDFEFILDAHIFSLLLIEDCYYNRLLSQERYGKLLQLNQEQ